jgi:hypothetical protein
MRRKLCLLVLALAIVGLSGVLAPAAQASSCTQHCFQPDCGDVCCVHSDCSLTCIHVVCGN